MVARAPRRVCPRGGPGTMLRLGGCLEVGVGFAEISVAGYRFWNRFRLAVDEVGCLGRRWAP